MKKGRVLIDIANIDVLLHGKTILTNVSWRLREGEHWAFLGGNGAGKSTFLKLIRGELWPDLGSSGQRIYALDGKRQESPVGSKERIALVSPERQDVYTRNGWGLTGEEIVHTGFFDSVWLHERPIRRQRAHAERIISLLGLDELRDKNILAMSEGEMRKILLARALVSRPKLLMLDEFCSGLDIPSKKKIVELIGRIAQRGIPIIYATHRKEELIPAISHLLFLSAGKIVKQGSKDGLLSGEDPLEALGADSYLSRKIPAVLQPRQRASDSPGYLVKIRNADVFIDDRKILEGINWTIHKGENWAVLGRNGAGKSTLLKLLLGDLHPALGGAICRFGANGKGDIRDIRKRIGYLSSELQGSYDWDLTGEAVVQSGFFSSVGLYRNVSDMQKKIARRWIRFFGVEGICDKSILQMSYGEVRKILLARAVVGNPDMLVLDEPCSGLDIAARTAFLDTLERLSKTGTGIIMVTHHPEDLIPFITHIVLMDGGRIVAAGRREAITGKDNLLELPGDLDRPPVSPAGAPSKHRTAR